MSTLILAGMGWGDHMDDWGAGWWLLMALLMLAVWGLLILGLVWLIRNTDRGSRSPDATELLDRRLATGEISPGEYEERRALLRSEDSGPGAPPSGS